RGNHTHLLADQIGHQLRIPILAAFRPAVCDRHVVALDITRFIQALPKGGHMGAGCCGRPDVDEPDHWHRRLLRARRERPRRRAAEKRDELASFHSITSSASASTVGGTSMPSVLTVLRLTTKSNLVGCSTGMSAGFAPRKILST